MILRSEFPILPRKISSYLRPPSSLYANTQIMRESHKALNSNNLCLRIHFSHCNKHHFSIRYGPFQGPKSTISRPNMDLIVPWNRQYQNIKWIIQDYENGYIKRLFSLKEPLLHRIQHSHTSISRFYFVKKMSRKIVSPLFGFSFKYACVRREKRHGNYAPLHCGDGL